MAESLFRVGDAIYVDPLYSRTTRDPRGRLTGPLRVIAVDRVRGCQSGFMVTVQAANGFVQELDQGWFLPPTG